MTKRSFVLISILVAASLILTACGGSSGGGGTTLKIVSSLPMTGASLTQTQSIVNAEQLALAQANNQACGGKYKISYEAWDDASAALGKWDPQVETSNAQKAAADKTIVAYLGTFNSGAAELSIPILNGAGPLVMVSPANTYPGLTKSVAGITADGEPNKYYPSGVRNYARLAPDDDLQGAVDVKFLQTLGVKTLYILDDQEAYGKGVADSVALAAKNAGITVLGEDGYDPKAADYKAEMTKISTSNNGNPPDAIFLGAIVDNNSTQIIKDKVSVMGDNTKVKFMGPDGIYTAAFPTGAGDAAEGAYASVGGIVFSQLGPAGQKFLTDYKAKYGPTDPDPYAVYGYDTMGIVLAGINSVCAAGGNPADRATLTKAVLATKDYSGALGTLTFDQNGDINLPYFVVGQVQKGAFVQLGQYTP
ncbi:MAG TPA: branched-chain amino acid ABC transporter substrate-binding protein [Anaerolineales bacterium]|nr:branched-chain amino acid ABC transporter substrate-binding protein [Anaerolineales bacterium]